MSDLLIRFEKKGFPVIEVYEDCFKVKAKNHWEFRSFEYNQIKVIKYYDPNDNWYTKLMLTFSNLMTQWAAQNGYRYLKIYKSNNGAWKYVAPEKIDYELIDVLKIIEFKIGSHILDIAE